MVSQKNQAVDTGTLLQLSQLRASQQRYRNGFNRGVKYFLHNLEKS